MLLTLYYHNILGLWLVWLFWYCLTTISLGCGWCGAACPGLGIPSFALCFFTHKKRAIRSKNQRANSQPCFLYNAFVRFIFVSLLDNVQFIFNRTEPRTTGSALSQWANTISATVLLTFSPFFSSPGSNYIFSARSRERAKPTSQEKPNKQSHKTITKQKKQ